MSLGFVVLFTSLFIVVVILVLTGGALGVVTGDVEAWCVIKGVRIRRGAVLLTERPYLVSDTAHKKSHTGPV
jgi:hypothetical protein